MVMYDVWEYVTEEYRGKNVRKLCKARIEGLLYQDLVRELQHNSFLLHYMNAKATCYKLHVTGYMWCKSSLMEEVVVSVYFAEN